MNGQSWLEDIRALYRQYKDMCERAVGQIGDDDLFATPGGVPHSIAVQMKHLGGNHRSRWRDFLTTDGEKEDRDRETEFDVADETRASIMGRWEEGWSIALASLDALGTSDLERTITIRGEPHGVVAAIHRNLNHVVYHTGQIVQLARQLAGDGWRTLSIAPGESEAFNASMRARFGDWWGPEGDAAD